MARTLLLLLSLLAVLPTGVAAGEADERSRSAVIGDTGAGAPALADMWTNACQGDLAAAIDTEIVGLQAYLDAKGTFDATAPRKIGVQHALCIDGVIAVAEQRKWWLLKNCREAYIDELRWTRDLLRGDMSDVYRLAQFYMQRNRDTLDQHLAFMLRQWAVRNHYPPAEFDEIQAMFGGDRSPFAVDRLSHLAATGYVPAMQDLARRYFLGEKVDRNRGLSWYWLKRLQQEGVDTSPVTSVSLENLLEAMAPFEKRALAYIAQDYGGLDLRGIQIPDAFAPLARELPTPLSDTEVRAFRDGFARYPRRTDDAYKALERDLLVRATGLRPWNLVSIHGQIRPLGMGNDEFVRRKCAYLRAVDRIFPDGRNGSGESFRWEEVALSSLFEKGDARVVKEALQCAPAFPNRETEGLTKALAWARTLTSLSPAAARALAAEQDREANAIGKRLSRASSDAGAFEEDYERLMRSRLARTLRKFADRQAAGRLASDGD